MLASHLAPANHASDHSLLGTLFALLAAAAAAATARSSVGVIPSPLAYREHNGGVARRPLRRQRSSADQVGRTEGWIKRAREGVGALSRRRDSSVCRLVELRPARRTAACGRGGHEKAGRGRLAGCLSGRLGDLMFAACHRVAQAHDGEKKTGQPGQDWPLSVRSFVRSFPRPSVRSLARESRLNSTQFGGTLDEERKAKNSKWPFNLTSFFLARGELAGGPSHETDNSSASSSPKGLEKVAKTNNSRARETMGIKSDTKRRISSHRALKLAGHNKRDI